MWEVQIKHLVIGYKGSIGSRHYRLLQEAGEEVCGWDIGEKPECKPDMTWICTPNSSHYLYAKDIDGKIFIEKPVTDNLQQAELLKGKQIWVASNYRFHPAVIKLKESLPKVGKVLYARLHFSHYLPYQRENWKEYMKDTNIIMDAGWHFVDLALWLFGKDWEYPLRMTEGESDLSASLELGFHDKTTIILSTKKCSDIQIDLDYLRRDKSWGVEVVGTEGTLKLQCASKNPEYSMVQFQDGHCWDTLFMQEIYPDEMYRNQLNYLLKENWKSNIDEALEVMKICS